MFYLHKVPTFMSRLNRSLEWHAHRDDKSIYLTFDDGPASGQKNILQILSNFNALATFFMVGENVKSNPEKAKEVAVLGHKIGNHTYNHLDGWKYSISEYLSNIQKCHQLLSQQGIETNLFRPPYGRIKRSQIKALKKINYRLIMWDVLSGDFDKRISAETSFNKSIQYSQNGSIIVFHDNVKANGIVSDILPHYIEYFMEKGYSFKTL